MLQIFQLNSNGRKNSLYQTIRGISASIASSIPFAATGGLRSGQYSVIISMQETHGTNIADAVAPVSFTASLTVAKTGLPKCVSPAFFGFVPPTTLVPRSIYRSML